MPTIYYCIDQFILQLQEDTTTLGATPSRLLLNAQPVDFMDSIGYLGLTISADLSWSKHIKNITSKQGN